MCHGRYRRRRWALPNLPAILFPVILHWHVIDPKTIVAIKNHVKRIKNHVKISTQRDGNLGKYVVGDEA
jgi:hypothetical protein